MDSSALFFLVKEANAAAVLEKLEPFKTCVLTTTLTEEQEQKLRAALDGGD